MGTQGLPWADPPTALLCKDISASTLPVPCLGPTFADPLSCLPAQVSTSVLASPAPQCVLFFLQSLTVCLSLVDPSAAPSLYTFTL